MIEQVPYVLDERRCETTKLGDSFFRVILRYGFLDEVDIPAALARIQDADGPFVPTDTGYSLSRQTVIPSARPGMMIWREMGELHRPTKSAFLAR